MIVAAGPLTPESLVTARIDKLYPLISGKDLENYAQLFSVDLSTSLSKQKLALPCILNPIYRKEPTPGYGITVSIGGTNGYVSAFRISNDGVITFLNRIFFPLPLRTTKDELFHLITKNVLAAAGNRKKPFSIGIGLAYPLKPLLHHGFIDGVLLEVVKEREIKDLVGKQVGQEYHKFLISEYDIDTTVMVANDSICLLLGGEGVEVAGVVGTGLNFAYWEKVSNISSEKLKELQDFNGEEVAVNIESKDFDKVARTPLLDSIDVKSGDPGHALSEKAASGAYLYQMFNAGKNEIIGDNFPEITATDQLNDMMTNAFVYSSDTTDEQKLAAKLFAERLFNRSAQMVAIQLAGIFMKIGHTSGIVPVVMEGGIFWKAKNFTSLVNLYMNMILPEAIPSFARLFGSSRRGMAILARVGAPEQQE